MEFEFSFFPLVLVPRGSATETVTGCSVCMRAGDLALLRSAAMVKVTSSYQAVAISLTLGVLSPWGWRDNPEDKRHLLLWQGTQGQSQHPHGDSQASLTLFAEG